jgi:hypothetical protein
MNFKGKRENKCLIGPRRKDGDVPGGSLLVVGYRSLPGASSGGFGGDSDSRKGEFSLRRFQRARRPLGTAEAAVLPIQLCGQGGGARNGFGNGGKKKGGGSF